MAAGAQETGFQQGEVRSWLHVYDPDTLVDVLRILSVSVHMKVRSKMKVANKRPHVPDVTNTATRVDYSFPAAIGVDASTRLLSSTFMMTKENIPLTRPR